MDNCNKCQGIKNNDICIYCNYGFYEKLDENNKIESCNKCKIGEGNKCLTCSEIENNKCASCNPTYLLVNGECILEEEIVKETDILTDEITDDVNDDNDELTDEATTY